MGNNLSIVYNAKVKEIDDNILQLSSIGVNTENFTIMLKEVTNNTRMEIKKHSVNFGKMELLTQIYDNAIRKLDSINASILEEYNFYFKLYCRYEELKTRVESISKEEILSIGKEVYEILNEVKKRISTIAEEESLVENLYSLLYQCIKLESCLLGSTFLLDYAKVDESDVSYISGFIKKEIAEKNSFEISKKVQEIDQNGLEDENYLDKDLLLLLSSELFGKMKSSFCKELEVYEETESKIVEMQEKENEMILKIKEIKKSIKKINLKRMLKKTFTYLSLGMAGIGMLASIRKAEDLGKTKVVQTLSNSYDSSLSESEQEEPVEEWLEEDENLPKLSIVEYSPWEDPGYFRSEYTRNVYTYTLTDTSVFYEDVRDYLNEEIKDKLTLETTIVYNSENPKENYSENKYIIRQTYQNKEVFDYEPNEDLQILWGVLFSAGILGVEGVFLLLLNKSNSIHFLKEKIKERKKELKETKQFLLENKNNRIELSEWQAKLREGLLNQYKESLVIQEDGEIKRRMRSLENKKLED